MLIVVSRSVSTRGPLFVKNGEHCHLSDKIGCFSENVPRCQAHSADELSLIMWRDTGLRWFFCCGFDEGLAQSGRKFGARLKTHVNSPEKRTYLLRPGMSRWLLSSGTLLTTTA